MSDHQIVVVSNRGDVRRVLRHLLGGKRKPRRLPRAPNRFPKDIEKSYGRALSAEARLAVELIRMRILPRLGELVRRDSVLILDAPAPLGRAFDEIQIIYGARISGDARSAARLAAAQTSSDHRKQIQKSTRQALGIQPEFTEPWLREESEDFVRRNVRLITNVGEQVFRKAEQTIDNGIRRGKRVEELARELEGALPEIGEEAERRAMLIARDQIGSFFGDLTERRQTDLGIERFVWSTVNDERVRESHRERDGKIFRWDQPMPEQLEEQGLEVDDIEGTPGIPIQCFPGDSKIQFADGVKKAFRRWYTGHLTEVVTTSGKTLKGTPNHPVLTLRGWLPLDAIQCGDHLIEVADQNLERGEEKQNDGEASIADVFEALSKGGITDTVPLFQTDFHGDGADSEVDVVFPARRLSVDSTASRSQRLRKLLLAVAEQTRSRLCAVLQHLDRFLSPAVRSMRSAGERLAFLFAEPSHTQYVSFRAFANLDPGLFEHSTDGRSAGLEAQRNRKLAFSSDVGRDDRSGVEIGSIVGSTPDPIVGNDASSAEVFRQGVSVDADDLPGALERLPFGYQASRVIKLSRIDFSGHVFNLETGNGWYTVNGIVVHNCRCVALPVLDDLLT